jgi:hypothetical protein
VLFSDYIKGLKTFHAEVMPLLRRRELVLASYRQPNPFPKSGSQDHHYQARLRAIGDRHRPNWFYLLFTDPSSPGLYLGFWHRTCVYLSTASADPPIATSLLLADNFVQQLAVPAVGFGRLSVSSISERSPI